MSDTVLVTGASGFIGSHLVERLLSDGHRVKAFIHYNSRGAIGNLEYLPAETLQAVEIITGNLCDSATVRAAVRGSTIVLHLGALVGIPYSYQSPRDALHTNVGGTLNVLEAVRAEGTRLLVHTSTSEVYGTARYTPMDEAHPLQAQSPYSATKIAADKLVESYVNAFELPAMTVRPFNTYGPRQSPRAIIPTIISQLLVGRSLRLGSVEPRRDFNFVTDTVDGFVRAMATPQFGLVVNLGSGVDVSIREVADRIAAIMGTTTKIEGDAQRVRPRASEVERLLADSSRAAQLLGWRSRVDMDDGLRQTVEWMRRHPSGAATTYRI